MKLNLISLAVFATILLSWVVSSEFALYRQDLFPYFSDFLNAAISEFTSGRVFDDVIASLFRWMCGFFLAVILAIPLGLGLGKNLLIRSILTPYLNLFRSLSPLAWIPFAVIWFGIGDAPVIFLIFLGCFFPLLFTTLNAVLSVPKVYDQIAKEYSYKGSEYFFEILFPAVLPQIVSSLRLVASLGWIVLVPGEMLAGKEGLGFAILDARNGMRTDILVFNMLLVALIAHGVDTLFCILNSKSQVRWSHEQ